MRDAYVELGPRWRKIGEFTPYMALIAAMRIPGRTDEQVAKRWKDVLAPDLKLEAPWTDEEDALLLDLYGRLGPKWTLMSDYVEGRNGIACRNRFRRFKTMRRWLYGSRLMEVQLAGDADGSPSSTPDVQAPCASVSTNDRASPSEEARESPVTTLSLNDFGSGDSGESVSNGPLDPALPFVQQCDIATSTSYPSTRCTNIINASDTGPSTTTPLQTSQMHGAHPPVPLDPSTPSSPSDLNQWLEHLQSMPGISATFFPSLVVNEVDAAQTPFPEWLDRMIQEAPSTHASPAILDNLSIVPTGHLTVPPQIPEPSAPTTLHMPDVDQPIENVWALIPALESGRGYLTLSTNLIRRLIDDAGRRPSGLMSTPNTDPWIVP